MAENIPFKKGVKVIIAKRFLHESLAEIYKAKLAEKDIKSFISNANTSTMIPFVGGGFTLHIDEADKDDVLKIVTKLDQNFENPVEQDFRDADMEDIIYAKEVAEYEESLEKSSLGDLITYGILILIILATLIYFATKH
jgi:hypothetical protein